MIRSLTLVALIGFHLNSLCVGQFDVPEIIDQPVPEEIVSESDDISVSVDINESESETIVDPIPPNIQDWKLQYQDNKIICPSLRQPVTHDEDSHLNEKETLESERKARDQHTLTPTREKVPLLDHLKRQRSVNRKILRNGWTRPRVVKV